MRTKTQPASNITQYKLPHNNKTNTSNVATEGIDLARDHGIFGDGEAKILYNDG